MITNVMNDIVNHFTSKGVEVVAEQINSTTFWVMLKPAYVLFKNNLEPYEKVKFLYVCIDSTYMCVNGEKIKKNAMSKCLNSKLKSHRKKMCLVFNQIDVKLSDYHYYVDLFAAIGL